MRLKAEVRREDATALGSKVDDEPQAKECGVFRNWKDKQRSLPEPPEGGGPLTPGL